ncbi:hypothetical protein KR054_000339 [Drosophila jambulina]|nr:hypothetical protein KR054_000339 [Drosophila jambulina]
MCVFPTCAAKIILLAVIPITIVFCVVEMGFAIYSLNTFFHTKKPEGSQLILLLIMTLLNLVGLVTGYYGTFAKKVVCVQVVRPDRVTAGRLTKGRTLFRCCSSS